MVELILSEAAHGAEPAGALWSSPSWWVALAMTIFFVVLIWKKAPAAIGAMLDGKIAAIAKQLSEAEQLRLDAESLKAEYEAKLARAAKEAEEAAQPKPVKAPARAKKAAPKQAAKLSDFLAAQKSTGRTT